MIVRSITHHSVPSSQQAVRQLPYQIHGGTFNIFREDYFNKCKGRENNQRMSLLRVTITVPILPLKLLNPT
jgi:hypothetical protein